MTDAGSRTDGVPTGDESGVPSPRCPRCAYDLVGSVATWTDSCPVEGICPECGLEFAWSDVFGAENLKVDGFFEHATGPYQSFFWAFRTLAWTILPLFFWHRVRLHHEVRVRKLLLWPIVVFGTFWFFITAIRSTAYLVEGRHSLATVQRLLMDLFNSTAFPFALLRDQKWIISPNGVVTTRPILHLELLVADWSLASYGIIATSLAMPLLVLALPVTRKRAKVRAVHVLRATVYGQAWLTFFLTIFLASALIGNINANWEMALGFDGPVSRYIYDYRLVNVLLLTGWIGLWWYCVFRYYFRLPSAFVHWAVLMLATFLLLLVFLASDEFLLWQFIK